jgi:hypothetical protein
MIVIHGESISGKSRKALSLLDPSKKSLYFALDFDKNIKKLELLNKNLQVTAFPKGSFLIDLEFEILNYGGLYKNELSYVVIDTINFLQDKKGFAKTIARLKRLEKEYNKFEVIAVVNTLHHFELKDDIKIIEGVKFIETKKKGKKLKRSTIVL